ncbi:MAG: F0F1 ATP synthase subunit B [Parcubacteria group bacterium]|nr:F0F1 ATP synthase subunit B [Parcubacteria group bacterium]
MEEFITHFGIDWKLLLAQVVNFSILLLVLRAFVYKPVLEILRKRKQEIEKGLQFSKDAEEQLKHTQELREDVLANAKKDALQIVSEAEKTAHERGETIREETTRKTEAAIVEAKRLIQEEKLKMKDSLYNETESLVRDGIFKVLQEIPAEVRDGKLIEKALVELKGVTKR